MSSTQPRRLVVTRHPAEPLSLEPGEAMHVSVDVRKTSESVALFSDDRALITCWVQPAKTELLIARLQPRRKGIPHVVYEAGSTSLALARRLRSTPVNTRPVRRDQRRLNPLIPRGRVPGPTAAR